MSIWIIAPLPALPVLFLYWSFRRVLYAKKFEMRTLLKRGKTLQKYLSAYGGAKLQDATIPNIEKDENVVDEIVNQIFRLRYSGLEYVWAITYVILIVTLLAILAMLLVGIQQPWKEFPDLTKSEILRNVVAGGTGAFIWGLYELTERYHSADLPPDAFLALGTRIIVVSSVGAVIGSFVIEKLAWPVAFGLGILPLKTVREFLAEKTTKHLNIKLSAKIEESPSLDLLQGWNSEASEKLSRAGILTVQELACTNQFQLYLRSNMDWRVILDLSDQALLALYIGKSIEKLRPLGIRSAVELAEIDWSDGDDDFYKDLKRSEAIGCIAKALAMNDQQVKLLITSIATDSTVNFLATLWSDATPDDEEEVPDEEAVASQP